MLTKNAIKLFSVLSKNDLSVLEIRQKFPKLDNYHVALLIYGLREMNGISCGKFTINSLKQIVDHHLTDGKVLDSINRQLIIINLEGRNILAKYKMELWKSIRLPIIAIIVSILGAIFSILYTIFYQ